MLAWICASSPAATEPTLSQILAASVHLDDGDIPEPRFQPPRTAVFVATAADGGKDSNDGSSAAPFEHLHRAIEYANANAGKPLSIYLRGGVHSFKDANDYEDLRIERGNLYVGAYQNEQVTVRPYYWPRNPTSWGNEHALVAVGPYENITVENLRFEGWSVIVHLGIAQRGAPMRQVTVRNLTAASFKRRNGEPDNGRVFLQTEPLSDDVYGEGKAIFDNPDTARYQIEGLTVSHVKLEDVDLAVDIGDENDANVKGLRISHLQVVNPARQSGNSANDGIAVVNSYKVLIDHCHIRNINDDGIDTKSHKVAVVNTIVEGTGRNAVKFWRSGEIINCILYNVTEIDDGAIIAQPYPTRIVNSLLLRHPVGYAGTYNYEGQSAQPLEIVNCAFGEVKSFYVGTSNLRAKSNRYFDILESSPIVTGQVNADDVNQLHALPNCSGNAMSTNQLRNPARGDFALRPGSSWIDAGVSSGVLLPAFDLFGNARVQGRAVDIGPIESSRPE